LIIYNNILNITTIDISNNNTIQIIKKIIIIKKKKLLYCIVFIYGKTSAPDGNKNKFDVYNDHNNGKYSTV